MIGALIVGLIVGAIAKLFMPGNDPGGWIITMLLGVAGAAIAHWIGVGAGWYGENESAGFVASVIGSMLLLYLYRVFSRRSALT